MLTKETKQTINSLSLEELLHEAVKGNKSSFQGEKQDYLIARYALLEKVNESSF